MKFGKKKKKVKTPTPHENKFYRKPTKKGQSGDYRRWARKYFKDGGREMLGIQPGIGIGEGTKRYCSTCAAPPIMTTYKSDGKGYCGKCGEVIKTYRPKEYNLLYHKLNKLPKWLWNIIDKRLAK